ncbi:hypothetical protein D3C84_68710 [compost metagenome]
MIICKITPNLGVIFFTPILFFKKNKAQQFKNPYFDLDEKKYYSNKTLTDYLLLFVYIAKTKEIPYKVVV